MDRPNESRRRQAAARPSRGYRQRRSTPANRIHTSTSGFGVHLGRLLGAELTVSWNLLGVASLLMAAMGAAVLPRWRPEWSALVTWGSALAAALALLGAVFLHELSRALMARALGAPMRRITLFALGGLARDPDQAHSPVADLRLALAAPLMSAALGVLSFGLGLELTGRAGRPSLLDNDAAVLSGLGPAPLFAFWFGAINLALVVAALMPVYPLDGGRLLRSALWGATGDVTRATRWAARAARAFALLPVTLGIFSVIHGAFAFGLWLALLGWFLNDAARRGYERVSRREACKNVPLERVMRTDVMRVDRDLTVNEFICGYLTKTPQRAFPVEDHGRLLGILRLSDVRKLPQHEWARTRAVQLMRAVEEVPALPPDAVAQEALDALTRRNLDQLPVVDRDHLVGVVTRSDLLRWLGPGGQGISQ